MVALDRLEAMTREAGFSFLAAGHGEISRDAAPIGQARAGLEVNEAMERPLPPEFANLPVAASKYRRSVGHLFPAAEQEALSNATLH